MMGKGFSFPCAALLNHDVDSETTSYTRIEKKAVETFNHFLETAEMEPSKINNAWPQLARWGNFLRPHTHPLIRTRYIARANPFLINLGHYLTFIHEKCHWEIDNTPAKEYARCLLAAVFNRLPTLLNARTWNERVQKTWSETNELNDQLSEIHARIALSEELLATAESFITVERLIRSNPGLAAWGRKLADFEKENLEQYENLFPGTGTEEGFSALYKGTFKKVISEIRNKYNGKKWSYFYSLLCLFLQGLDPEYDSMGEHPVIDDRQNCLVLAKNVKEMNSSTQLYDWLFQNQVQNAEGRELWNRLSALLAEEAQESPQVWALWQIANGKAYRTRSYENVLKTGTAKPALFDSKRIGIILLPYLFGDEWVISPFEWRTGSKGRIEVVHFTLSKNLESYATVMVLKMEALRQQLEERDGICCPYYIPGECRCQLTWKKSLLRISQWAKDGRFGPGTWQDLPPACRCGV